MIALNGKPLTEFHANDPLAKHVRAALKRIKGKDFWNLVFHESKIMTVKSAPGQAGGRTETSAGILQMATSKYVFDGMDHDITYYKRINKIKDTTEFFPTYVDYSGSLPLDPKKEADLIFYMVCVLPACAPYDFMAEYQNKTYGKSLYYKVEDLVDDAFIANVAQKKISKVSTLIYDEDFGLKEPLLRVLALNHGVADADEIDIDLLRQQLKKILLTPVKGDVDMIKIQAFLDDVKSSSKAALRSLVQKADKEKLILVAPNSSKKPSWYDTDADGKQRIRIMTIPKDADPITSLVAHYAKKPEARLAFERYVERGGGGEAGRPSEHNIEDLTEKKVN